ncbi:MAG: restriction endonuclease subunit S, partial [Eubacterium sp.]|nr:restriction endonuclease subunit S [Eubacterium sp.]
MEYIKFSEFIEKTQYGYTAERTSSTEGDAKYLRITDIVPYFVDKGRVPFCDIAKEKISQYQVKEDDLLIARTGATTGYNLIVPKGFDNYIFASYLVRYYYDKTRLYPKFLKHVLKSQQYYGFVANYIGGSAQPGMNPKAFGRFQVPYFNYNYQVVIADVLEQYDLAIENNNKRIKILEQMAENLYKEWFVRFRFPGHEDVEFK